jgi:hypothetical protein
MRGWRQQIAHGAEPDGEIHGAAGEQHDRTAEVLVSQAPVQIQGPRRVTPPPNTASDSHMPAARKLVCSATRPTSDPRAASCSAGACHAHTTISSPIEAGTGANAAGHRRTGSKRRSRPRAVAGHRQHRRLPLAFEPPFERRTLFDGHSQRHERVRGPAVLRTGAAKHSRLAGRGYRRR